MIVLLIVFGNPGPIETSKVFPDTFKIGSSPFPAITFTILNPPPDHPSFFMETSMLEW